MATPLEVLKSKVGILADPIAEYVAAILADYSGIVVPPDASSTPEQPPVITPPVEVSGIILEVVSNDPYGKVRIVSDKQIKKGGKVRINVTGQAFNVVGVNADSSVIDLDQKIGNPQAALNSGYTVILPITVPPVVTPNPDASSTVPDGSGDLSYMRKKGRIFINLGMGAGADHVLPGKEGTNYTFLTEPEIKRAVGYGFKQFRVGFIMGRVYKRANSLDMYRGIDPNDTTRKYTLDTIIDRLKICNKYNTKVLLDNHVYAFWPSNGAPNKVELGTSGYTAEMLANHWYGIIQELKKDPEAWNAVYGFDIVNEPYTLSDATWSKCVQAVIDKCASISEDKIFVIEGISYSSTRNWVANNPSLSKITHPRGKAFLEFSGHLYLDAGASGYYSGDVLSQTDINNGITFETVGTARLAGFKKWKDDNKVNASIGENLVTGTLTNLMKGERNLLEDCINSGIDVYLFGMGDGFGSGNAHNIELKTSSIDNTNMLNLAIEMAKK